MLEQREKGSVLTYTLILIILVSIFVLGIRHILMGEISMGQSERKKTSELYSTDAGTSLALQALNENLTARADIAGGGDSFSDIDVSKLEEQMINELDTVDLEFLNELEFQIVEIDIISADSELDNNDIEKIKNMNDIEDQIDFITTHLEDTVDQINEMTLEDLNQLLSQITGLSDEDVSNIALHVRVEMFIELVNEVMARDHLANITLSVTDGNTDLKTEHTFSTFLIGWPQNQPLVAQGLVDLEIEEIAAKISDWIAEAQNTNFENPGQSGTVAPGKIQTFFMDITKEIEDRLDQIEAMGPAEFAENSERYFTEERYLENLADDIENIKEDDQNDYNNWTPDQPQQELETLLDNWSDPNQRDDVETIKYIEKRLELGYPRLAFPFINEKELAIAAEEDDRRQTTGFIMGDGDLRKHEDYGWVDNGWDPVKEREDYQFTEDPEGIENDLLKGYLGEHPGQIGTGDDTRFREMTDCVNLVLQHPRTGEILTPDWDNSNYDQDYYEDYYPEEDEVDFFDPYYPFTGAIHRYGHQSQGNEKQFPHAAVPRYFDRDAHHNLPLKSENTSFDEPHVAVFNSDFHLKTGLDYEHDYTFVDGKLTIDLRDDVDNITHQKANGKKHAIMINQVFYATEGIEIIGVNADGEKKEKDGEYEIHFEGFMMSPNGELNFNVDENTDVFIEAPDPDDINWGAFTDAFAGLDGGGETGSSYRATRNWSRNR
ncbi:MAG: hypothetical protein ACOCVB_02240 [Bacillota bacterium]